MLLQRRPKVIKPGETDLVQRPRIACNGEQSPTQVDDIGLRPFLFPVSVDDLLYEFGIGKGRKHNPLKPEWVVLMEVLRDLQAQPYAKPVGRTIFQKISYVVTEMGVPTGFQFSKGSYGSVSTFRPRSRRVRCTSRTGRAGYNQTLQSRAKLGPTATASGILSRVPSVLF